MLLAVFIVFIWHLIFHYIILFARFIMVARSPNSERKMYDDLPDVNVAADFYARYDIREVLGKSVFSFTVFSTNCVFRHWLVIILIKVYQCLTLWCYRQKTIAVCKSLLIHLTSVGQGGCIRDLVIIALYKSTLYLTFTLCGFRGLE